MADYFKAKEDDLRTKSARKRLEAREAAYYVRARSERGKSLGYERRESGPGAWIVRERAGNGYSFRTLGLADDLNTPDGRDTLTFDQALAKAMQPTLPPKVSGLTVAAAMDRYLETLAAKSAHATEARQRAEKHIIPTLGRHRVDRLAKTQIEHWLGGMVRADTEEDLDAKRRSKDSANRILTILRAALNHAFADDANNIPNDSAWRRVKAFKAVDSAREDHFNAVQIRQLIAKAATFDRAFANLCEAGYLTGARLGELTALEVRDFNAQRSTLHIRKGKTGTRVVTLTAEGVAFFKRLAQKRLPGALLLPRADGDRWGKSQQAKPFKRAAALAKLPRSASFYSLRHSHISRAIEAGMPLSLVAENCGTSLAMIERNYAKMLAATRRELVEATSPKLRRVK